MSAYCVYKCYTCFKALLFGEDLVSDSVGTLLSLVLRRVSHGSIDVDVQLLSQVCACVWRGAQMHSDAAAVADEGGARGAAVQLLSQVGAGPGAQQCSCCRKWGTKAEGIAVKLPAKVGTGLPGGQRRGAGWLGVLAGGMRTTVAGACVSSVQHRHGTCPYLT